MASASEPNLNKSAIQLLKDGVFPKDWKYVPVCGKATFEKDWVNKPLAKEECAEAYRRLERYKGVGVVTGGHSNGLIALDIDGEKADLRYKKVAGEAYREFGSEDTMAFTSGKPGRRQLLYRVPDLFIPLLRDVKTIILRLDGEWSLGQGDVERTNKKNDSNPDANYQEVVIRFNACQSVLPGSPHPDTGNKYRFLNYNNGVPEPAPDWMLDVLRQFTQPVKWLSETDVSNLKREIHPTTIPLAQMRGWFFKEAQQQLLRPRLADLIFKHPTFDAYGWTEREGSNPQMMSGCPWHGGDSGTAFQYSVNTGCWDCKSCNVGGDVLDFIHKIETNDINASRPGAVDTERYISKIATDLGYNWPDDALPTSKVQDVPRVVMSAQDFLDELSKISKTETNPAIRKALMADLARSTGRNISGVQCVTIEAEHRGYLKSRQHNDEEWYKDIDKLSGVIPNVLVKPSQTILHAKGGLGKTSCMMAFASAIIHGKNMRIRGLDISIPKGKVLWIQNDQNKAKLLQDCEANNIEFPRDKDVFIVKRGFQLNYQHDLREWINKHEPELVVIDSIGSCSTKMEEDEKDKAFATPFYDYSNLNGEREDLDGFRACAIVWIHHNNALGQMRGTKYLEAAVDEVWHLRTLTEEERERMRDEGHRSNNCRFIEICKSRLDRSGDVLVTERDTDYAFNVWDYTPTEKKENGTGDAEPDSMLLRIFRDRARGESFEGGCLSIKDAWELLAEEMVGQARKASSQRSVSRWIDRYVREGLLVKGVVLKGGPSGNVRTATYRIPPIRGGDDIECHLSNVRSNWLRRNGSTNDNTNDKTEGVKRETPPPESGEVEPATIDTPEADIRSVNRENDCSATEDAPRMTKDSQGHTPREAQASPEDGECVEIPVEDSDFDAAFG